jgi:Zn-dependent protease
MGWEDRPYYRDRGFSSNRLTALLSGSVPFFTVFGIRVRIHSALILFIACELFLNWTPGYDLAAKIVSMTLLLAVVLLHEFGHCLAARAVGGYSAEVILWPLGGMTFPEIPPRPGARFIAIAGGPLVNVILCAASAALVWFLGGHTWVPFNPLASPLPAAEITWRSPVFYAWWLFITSYLLLVLTMLPIYPLDGGQMLQTLLWRFVGHHRAMTAACIAGMCGAAALGIFGLLRWDILLIALAAWLFFACYQERVLLHETGPVEPWQDDGDLSTALYRDPVTRRRRVSKKALRIARKHAQKEAAERLRLDALLAKVSAKGLSSLNWRERRALRAATEKRRQTEKEMNDYLGD